MATVCTGNSEGHCCWVNGEVCPYLEENTVKGRRWVCGLLVKFGSWEEVYKSESYKTDVKQPLMDRLGVPCGEWPPKGEVCAECGITGIEFTNG